MHNQMSLLIATLTPAHVDVDCLRVRLRPDSYGVDTQECPTGTRLVHVR